jgi:hypothetical protein
VGRTTVHGTQEAAAGAKDAFHGLKDGSEVAVHYTDKGTSFFLRARSAGLQGR